jgi:hypothetical protein
MAVDGSIYQHARAVQNRTVGNGIGYAGGLKPSRQVFQSSSRSSENFNKSDALVMRLLPETSLGVQTEKAARSKGARR